MVKPLELETKMNKPPLEVGVKKYSFSRMIVSPYCFCLVGND